jgi:hypothetical protein
MKCDELMPDNSARHIRRKRNLMTLRTLAVAAVVLIPASLRAEWKPAPAPLMTAFAKDVSPDKVHPEYPRPQMMRKEWVNLNGLWQYAITKKHDDKPAKWDGEILVPYCVESALSGVGKKVTPEQALWYRRTFKGPERKGFYRVLLHFGAVDWHAQVWVNGKMVGEHKGGFDPFTFSISPLKEDGEQEIVVRVWDPTDQGAQPRGKQVRNPGGIFYTSVTGIWQTVWLEPVPISYIDRLHIVPNVDAGEVAIDVESHTLGKGDRQIKAVVRDGDKMISEATGPAGKTLRIKVPNAKLWSPESPHLYDVTVSLISGERTFDTVESYFAMRKISVGKDDKGINRIFFNGKPLFQLGPLDQGWWPDGLLTPPTDEGLAFDIKKLKELGFNMMRKHVKVEPARFYHHCDKLGLLVWQDMPSGMGAGRKQNISPDAKEDAVFTDEEKKQFRTELKAMIDHLRNFPCIVTWVPFNEGWGQHDTNEILKWVKEYDPTRLVDGPSGWADRGYGDFKDAHIYPGPGMFPVEKDRVSVLGEFGGLGLPLEGHLWQNQKNWGYRTYKTKEELRDAYRALIMQMHPLIGDGLAAAVYTQTTDVESEVNGLMTYDRKVVKLDEKEAAKWHKALFGPPPEQRVLVQTSEKDAQTWRYTIAKPAAGWEKPEFDASKWKEGRGGFGSQGTPGAMVRTDWRSADIWIRRDFDLKNVPKGELFLRLHHDEDAEIYINGVLAAKVAGYVTTYGLEPVAEPARKALKAGKNTIAIHCHQTTGGQYIDGGLVEWVASTDSKK